MTGKAQAFKAIKANCHHLTRQQFKTLMGQAKAGNPDAALRGLEKIIKRGQTNER